MVRRDQVRGVGGPDGGPGPSAPSSERTVEALGPAADAKLVGEIAAGSERALARVYDRHGGQVFTLARRILGDVRLAEDVTEAVFLDLWDRPASFDDGRASLRCHLLLDARSRSFALLRSLGTGPDGGQREGSPRPALARGRSGHPDGLEDETGADLLSAEQRRVVELAYFEGYSCGQAAALLDLTEATVRAQIDSGLRRLLPPRPGDTGR